MKNNRPTVAQIAEFANDMWEGGCKVEDIAVYMNAPTMERHDVPATNRIGKNDIRFRGFDISEAFAIAIDELGNAMVLLHGGARRQIIAGE